MLNLFMTIAEREETSISSDSAPRHVENKILATESSSSWRNSSPTSTGSANMFTDINYERSRWIATSLTLIGVLIAIAGTEVGFVLMMIAGIVLALTGAIMRLMQVR